MQITIFDILKNVLSTKQKDLFSDIESESVFSPYMLNRWLSMYSSKMVQPCSRINKYGSVFTDKKQNLRLFQNLIPKSPVKKISYIKKVKETKAKEIENLALIAQNMELSQREVKSYIEYDKET